MSKKFNVLQVRVDCNRSRLTSGEARFVGHDFAGERQALAAFHLAAKLGIGGDRAIAAGDPGRFTDLVHAKGIADADDQRTASQTALMRGVITHSER